MTYRGFPWGAEAPAESSPECLQTTGHLRGRGTLWHPPHMAHGQKGPRGVSLTWREFSTYSGQRSLQGKEETVRIQAELLMLILLNHYPVEGRKGTPGTWLWVTVVIKTTFIILLENCWLRRASVSSKVPLSSALSQSVLDPVWCSWTCWERQHPKGTRADLWVKYTWAKNPALPLAHLLDLH